MRVRFEHHAPLLCPTRVDLPPPWPPAPLPFARVDPTPLSRSNPPVPPAPRDSNRFHFDPRALVVAHTAALFDKSGLFCWRIPRGLDIRDRRISRDTDGGGLRVEDGEEPETAAVSLRLVAIALRPGGNALQQQVAEGDAVAL